MPTFSPLVGRIAPSPTGQLHIGHARTFLIAWWSMRSQSGRLLLRMDDLDHTRIKPGMVAACLEDLEWLGLDWDGGIYYQSEQIANYQAAVDTLLAGDKAYACICTRNEIQAALSAPHLGELETPYPGTCRDRFQSPDTAQAITGRPAGIRLRVPRQPIQWTDLMLGPQSTPIADQVGDFLIARRDQVFAYQLACAIDEAAMGVTEVLRGDDLAPSAARQEFIQRTLGLPVPLWKHVPLVLDESGERLAKRNQSITLASLRAAGVDPRALVAWVAQSCAMHPPPLPKPADLIQQFSLDALPKSPMRFTAEDLASLGRA